MAYTSESHPIELNPICRSPLGSTVYLTFAPGKFQPRSQHHRDGWNRNLDMDLSRMRDTYQIHQVVSLLEPDEAIRLRLGEYPQKAQQYGFEYKNYPIKDMNIPPGMPENFPLFHQFIQEIVSDLAQGKNIVVHCMGGLGRAGTIGSCILVCEGYDPNEAIRWVQTQRRSSIKRPAQQQFVRDYANYIQNL